MQIFGHCDNAYFFTNLSMSNAFLKRMERRRKNEEMVQLNKLLTEVANQIKLSQVHGAN